VVIIIDILYCRQGLLCENFTIPFDLTETDIPLKTIVIEWLELIYKWTSIAQITVPLNTQAR
jgi:hypothetical protein